MNGLSKKEKRDKAINLLYVLPMLAIFLVFILYPITQVFYMSFFERKVNGTMIFVGLQNFADLFANPDTPRMFKNTFVWVFVGVAFKLILGLLMALILYKKFLGKKMMTAIMLIPYAMPAAVSCMIWRLMYNPMFGHITQFLMDTHILGLPVDFLGNSKTSLIAVMIVNIWAVAPFCALNILSTMYSIPSYIYEAARIDGANSWQQFWSITLPLITSSVRTLGLLIGIWAFNTFDVIYMMTQGGPANSSSIMVNFIYQNAFQFNNRGYSAAISVVSFLILSVFAVLYVNSKGEDTRYE
ncbi:MAG: sugar ABC transporter permease [Clostridium sp.]|nr:sugar ABC transporter permease [Clostridium sp.]